MVLVVAQCYGLMRLTADIYILESKNTDLIMIAKVAGRIIPLDTACASTSSRADVPAN